MGPRNTPKALKRRGKGVFLQEGVEWWTAGCEGGQGRIRRRSAEQNFGETRGAWWSIKRKRTSKRARGGRLLPILVT